MVVLAAVVDGKDEVADERVVELEIGELGAVGRPPDGVRLIEHLFFVEPVGDAVVDGAVLAVAGDARPVATTGREELVHEIDVVGEHVGEAPIVRRQHGVLHVAALVHIKAPASNNNYVHSLYDAF